MATSQAAPTLHPRLLSRLQEARSRTDDLFRLLPASSFYDRPIAERHRMIFYLGHLEAFDWNLLAAALDIAPHDAEFDKLFAFGIDPVGGGLPADTPRDWPTIAQVEDYNRVVRSRLDEALADFRALRSHVTSLGDGTLLHVAIEHRLMHAETIAYLLHNLPIERKTPQAGPAPDPRPAPEPRQVTIPAGTTTLGQLRGSDEFGWDNEFGSHKIHVPSFSIDAFPVTNAQYLKFVQAGGYQNPKFWSAEDWEWKRSKRLEHPYFWINRSGSAATGRNTRWEYVGMFGTIPLPPSWPVYVSHAEASAFARWAGQKLPTEAQWHRAAYGLPDGSERSYPWGEEAPSESHGNFHHRRWDATAVNEHPAGASAFGVFDLLGNGWEWTSSAFDPFPGFQQFPFYPGYSANFFDGKHFVMKGGSARTDACMLRRSFRNWFQPHYPHIYATFRCVED
ncbi:MAG TPA: SUMF1/EgtB/PvdO family nonheme iron enzyme [Candidatus Acidoferrales bacterium]|nr:SUMF1/EgtB/PvdO family nonheme iron enzyme [Candidatus Acidoferrales bacterium]